MSDISTTAKVTLIVNGEQASQFINGLKRDPVLQCDPPRVPLLNRKIGLNSKSLVLFFGCVVGVRRLERPTSTSRT